ncbi:class I SAM-dependent methyltransferase [uncultured Lamprocystis sp.]|jgi:SAM-dependent methyltransferase|uniref:class I SAM-dependent methyltransferase n=1 Tax=uncultured Lamprocystis sp. TaxID=543132 RepID=UPI0025F9CDE3|nr:methyltransferase domain-containing protein [uncultured Lamprocystis sp.]
MNGLHATTLLLIGLTSLPTTAAAAAADREQPAASDAAPSAPSSSVHSDRAVSPLLNRHYQDGDLREWTQVFERPGREVFDQRFKIVHAVRPHPGMRIADIGAGTGLFTVLFARAVGPDGLVYAVDTSPSFVAGLHDLAARYRVDNIVPAVSTQEDTRLPAAGIELAFVCDTYHHFEYPRAMLDSIHQALVPGGALVIIDYRRRPGLSSPWVLQHVRADRDQVVAEVRQAGFRLVEEPDFLTENYFLRFEKHGDTAGSEADPGAPVAPPHAP